jgi:hypothetical protein
MDSSPRSLWVGAGVVLQVAVDRRLQLQLGVADGGAGTHVAAVEDVRAGAVAGDGHGLHRGADGGVHVGGFRQLQVDAFAFFRLAVLGDDDRVRTAGTQAAGHIAAFGIGNDIADRTGLGVDDRDRRTAGRLAVGAGNAAADGRGGVLGEGRRRRQRDGQGQCQLGQLNPFVNDHCITPKKANSYVESL